MKRVIVSGATGFVGRRFTEYLLRRGVEVAALDRRGSLTPLSASGKPSPAAVFDLTDGTETQDGAYDAFYHFAWQGVNGPEKADPLIQTDNIRLTIECASLAKRIGCKKFLCAGTVAERAVESLGHLEKTSGGMMYGAAKHSARLMLEAYCKSIGLDFVWMQFSNVYGPGNTTGNLVSYTLASLLNNVEASFGPAVQPYDFIYIDDLMEAICRLGECDTRDHFYFIGSGEPRPLKEYLQLIGRLLGKEHLIQIGKRPDDGIVYTYDMFDTQPLSACIGQYTSTSFEEGIRLVWEQSGR